MFTHLHTRCSTTLASIALAAIGVAAVGAAPARAAVPSSAACASDAALSQPFAQWGDTNEYRLIPGGDFTSGAPGWSLNGGASVVSGGDPFDLTGSPSQVSLSLPAGASVSSPLTCVDASQPTLRMLDVADSPQATVRVSVTYANVTVPVGVISGTGSWTPSAVFQDGSAIASLVGGGSAQMTVGLTALTGTTQINDVFVDPRQGWN